MPYEKAQVKDAPKIDPDGELSEHEEDELYRHYGVDYRRQRGATDRDTPTATRPADAPGTSAATRPDRRPTTR